jgi:hypothetical protein
MRDAGKSDAGCGELMMQPALGTGAIVGRVDRSAHASSRLDLGQYLRGLLALDRGGPLAVLRLRTRLNSRGDCLVQYPPGGVWPDRRGAAILVDSDQAAASHHASPLSRDGPVDHPARFATHGLSPTVPASRIALSRISHSDPASRIGPNLSSPSCRYGVTGAHRGIPTSSGAGSFLVLPYAERACAILSARWIQSCAARS